jgi:hypothetical protein
MSLVRSGERVGITFQVETETQSRSSFFLALHTQAAPLMDGFPLSRGRRHLCPVPEQPKRIFLQFC